MARVNLTEIRIDPAAVLRAVIVSVCGLALILAGHPLPL